ncbi:Proprotein convertase subtilisin/kexin type 6 [Myotis davidii]|uniref:Proprotein convertase subtilisin/kexin type 6 n=1 Tax=Myotis davidii TaxID=225400 RepID=L5LDA1_MYODS|nr:Proprotein convertase subtilisin/kexin type 6 [Myotis davidii]
MTMRNCYRWRALSHVGPVRGAQGDLNGSGHSRADPGRRCEPLNCDFREEGRGRERETSMKRENHGSAAFCTPPTGDGAAMQTGRVPLTGNQTVTTRFIGQHSTIEPHRLGRTGILRVPAPELSWELTSVTTDLRQRCTDGHTGTSVSAPMVAGIIALALEANSQLTWRDVQHLLVKTSRPAHLKANDWKVNGAGHKVSHLYGFGLVDAEALVLEAKKWTAVPSQHTCVAFTDKRPRLLDHSNEGFSNWEFMTVHSWGEKAEGEWTLEIQDMPSQVRNPGRQGKLKEWSLVLYGTAEHPYHTFSSHGSQSGTHIPHSDSWSPTVSSCPSQPSPAGPPRSWGTGADGAGVCVGERQGLSLAGVCHPECGDQGCDGPGADQCLNCVHFSLGSAKTGRKCVSECPLLNPCPAGFYALDSQRKCLKCHPSCKTCVDDPEKCTVCKEGFSLARGSCIPDCEPGTYFDSELVRCGQCHPTCKTCVADKTFCEMVKCSRLCERKLFIHFCCRPMGGGPQGCPYSDVPSNSACRPHPSGDTSQNPHVYRIFRPKWSVKHVASPSLLAGLRASPRSTSEAGGTGHPHV